MDEEQQYYLEIGQIKVLIPEEELEQFQAIEIGNYAIKELSAITSFEPDTITLALRSEVNDYPLNPEQTDLEAAIRRLRSADYPERAYWELALRGQLAHQQVVEANLRLVVYLARKRTGRGLSLEDLIQEGNLGLLHTVDLFNYHLGFKFSTYASKSILDLIKRAIANQSQVIRVPVHVLNARLKLIQASSDLEAKLKRPPTTEEIAAALGQDWDEHKIQEISDSYKSTPSLDALLSDDDEDGLTLLDVLVAPDEPAPDQKIDGVLLSNYVETLLKLLPEPDCSVIQLRYGLTSGREHTLQEIGAQYGKTREWARRVETRALAKLQEQARQMNLQDFLD